FQDICLSIKTHYGNHEFTSYLLLGKSFFKWFKDECLSFNRRARFSSEELIRPISEIITKESNNVKKNYFRIRNNSILRKIDNRHSTDFAIKADFSEYIKILKRYDPILLWESYMLEEFEEVASKLIDKVPIENPASYHKIKGSGYISYYLVDATLNGSLDHDKTLHYLSNGLKIFYSKLNKSGKVKAQRILFERIQKKPSFELSFYRCFKDFEDFLSA
ncbi:MAG: hypothetical protein AAF329_05970, partial [Cyanobacteria bacterium P01_A01_bin.17]